MVKKILAVIDFKGDRIGALYHRDNHIVSDIWDYEGNYLGEDITMEGCSTKDSAIDGILSMFAGGLWELEIIPGWSKEVIK